MLGIALTSVAAGIFDLKHYLNLQLVPHISKHHQVRHTVLPAVKIQFTLTVPLKYWRLLVYHLVCGSSSDLLLVETYLYNVSICVERAFGSVKYAVCPSSSFCLCRT